jgi:hypothetical protein
MRLKPSTMSTSPNLLNERSGETIIFLTQVFILSGKAKYGSPSMIITIPMTHKKNSIGISVPIPFDETVHGDA